MNPFKTSQPALRRNSWASIVFGLLFLWGCSPKPALLNSDSPIHFTSIPAAASGIHFNNRIIENDSVNLIANAYAYMGSGIGIGDFNNDGLDDIFFGANQQSSQLYLNKGAMRFEDVTKKAGVQTSAWVTGISVVDINSDGFDDIYVCVAGKTNSSERKNLLFVNNKDLTFSEQAEAYGLADTSYTTQAVFLDYDKDGDLDVYLLNHLLDHQQSNNIVAPNRTGTAPAQDKLFKNNGPKKGDLHPYFQNVSAAAGIIDDGYGLGIVMCDVNGDTWPDLYVANDYLANDILWLNNKNGTFSNAISRSVKHQSYSSMGVDAGDVNNDGLPDIVSLDMQPEDNKRKKMMYSFLNYDRYVMERRAGYDDEYMRNMLQLNNGVRTINDTVVPFFSEVGQLAGISETDWSWSVLMADFDNDGWKDIHITNGLGRDMINSDFISFAMAAFGRGAASESELNRHIITKLNEYGTVELSNYCYRNNKDLKFKDVTKTAGLDVPSLSNACVYADLDNDGDLDLVVSNINKDVFVWQNDLRTNGDSTHNFIYIRLVGDSLNKKGIGAQLRVYSGGMLQTAEQSLVRGYLSCVSSKLFVGVGYEKKIDSILIVWPNGLTQKVTSLNINQTITLKQADALQPSALPVYTTSYLFTEVGAQKNIFFKHAETFFYDYGPQQTLPQKYSQLGPFLATADVNGDDLEDFFVGGAAGQSGRLLFQQANGQFLSRELLSGGKPQEDLGCLFFDADGDGDLDLFVNSGGNEFKAGSLNYVPRLYLNDGKGIFSLAATALPTSIFTSAQCVAAADYDGDADLDLFIGGRISPGQYPASPASYILQNNSGVFTDVTSDVCAALQLGGMITAAAWSDINNDRKPDLIVAGEWMPVRFFINRNGTLHEALSPKTAALNGQWRSLALADLDKDGDIDIVAGNVGLNTKYKVSNDQPLRLFAKDLDANGSIDPVLAYYMKNKSGKPELFPAISRDQFAAQVPAIKKSFLLHADYAAGNMESILGVFSSDEMMRLTCNETHSVWLENDGRGNFEPHALPIEAQVAPINAIICTDANGDGNTDIIVAGNEYQMEVSTGRYDASYGLLLLGNGAGRFNSVAPASSGLILDGDVKDLKLVSTVGKSILFVAAINDEKVRTFEFK